jgi:hypothetical protein
LHQCTFKDKITVTSGSSLIITEGVDASATGLTAPEFAFEANTTIGFRGWHGGLKINGVSAGCYAKIDGSYRLVIGSDCTGGDIVMRGFACEPTDEVVGGFQGTISQTQAYCQSNTVPANLVSIDGALTNGNNATLNLKQLNVVNDSGTAIVASGTDHDIEAREFSNMNVATINGHAVDDGTLSLNLAEFTSPETDANNTMTEAIFNKLPTGQMSDLSRNAMYDGETFEHIQELLLAMINGRYKENTPVQGQVTYYKRDNVTPITVLEITDTTITRVS